MSIDIARHLACTVIACISLVFTATAGLGATKVNSLPISRSGKHVQLLIAQQGNLYVGLPTSAGSLHCYSTSLNALLWSAGVGTVVSERSSTGYDVLTPRQVALSPSMQYVNVLTAERDKLVVLNQSNGNLVNERDIAGARHILAGTIGGTNYVLVLSNDSIHVIDQSSIESDVHLVTLPHGLMGGVDYDDTTNTMYFVMQDTDKIVSCALTSTGGVVSHILQTVSTDDKPYDCEIIGNSVWVACTSSGTINKYNKSTLILEATYSGLKNISCIAAVGNYFIVSSYYDPLYGSTKQRGSVLFLDVTSGAETIVSIDDAYPEYIDTTSLPNSVAVFNEGTLEKVKTSTSVSMQVKDGNMWVYNASNGALTDNTLLPGGYFISAYCIITQRMYVVEAGGTAIDVYTF